LLEVLFKGNLHAFLLQIEKLEQEIQEKRKQMRGIEQRIIESGETSVANPSLVEIQQVAIFILSSFKFYVDLKVVSLCKFFN
jgi:hypothetical protein